MSFATETVVNRIENGRAKRYDTHPFATRVERAGGETRTHCGRAAAGRRSAPGSIPHCLAFSMRFATETGVNVIEGVGRVGEMEVGLESAYETRCGDRIDIREAVCGRLAVVPDQARMPSTASSSS